MAPLDNDSPVLLSTSYTDSSICVWDTRQPFSQVNSSVPASKAVYTGPSGVINIGFRDLKADNTTVYASCLDGSIYCYEIYGLLQGSYSYPSDVNHPEAMVVPGDWNVKPHFCNLDISSDYRFLATGMMHMGIHVWSLSKRGGPLVWLDNSARTNITFCCFSPHPNLEVLPFFIQIIGSTSQIPLFLWLATFVTHRKMCDPVSYTPDDYVSKPLVAFGRE